MRTTTKHPTLTDYELTFDPGPHTYTDNNGNVYESATTIVKRHFPPFDATAALKSVASRTGRSESDIQREWDTKRDAAAAFGTLVHKHAEDRVQGVATPDATNELQAHAFSIVDRAVEMLRATYDFLGAEVVIFDPVWLLAGTVDLLARNRATNALAIIDWKTCESITTDSYGRAGLPPIESVPDSKFHHYEMQISLYAWLLTEPGYTCYSTEGQAVELALVHIPHIGYDPVWRPCTYRRDEVTAMVTNSVKYREPQQKEATQ